MESIQSSSIIKPGTNGASQSLQRLGFGEQSLETRRETQGAALAERAKAQVQARYIMALQRPRNLDEVRVRILSHCGRPGFAEAAEYAKPVGGQAIRGPSIRFVETALQEYGNVMPDIAITFDDAEKRITSVTLTDLERNITYSDDAIIEKIVERRRTKPGDEVIGQRTNSRGEPTYIVRATEDEVANKAASAVSKKLRNLGLRILPADLVDEAMETCKGTRGKRDAVDPSAARKKIVDAFAQLGVMPRAIAEYLGHPLEESSPVELDELRVAYQTVRDGEARWGELIEAKQGARAQAAPAAAATTAPAANDGGASAPKKASPLDAVKAKLEAKAKKATSAKAPPAAPALAASVKLEPVTMENEPAPAWMGEEDASASDGANEFTEEQVNALEQVEYAESLPELAALHRKFANITDRATRMEIGEKFERRAEVLRREAQS